MIKRYLESVRTIQEQFRSGGFQCPEDDCRRKVDWGKMSPLEILRARLGKEVEVLHNDIYIFSLEDWRRAVSLYRECHRWRHHSLDREYKRPESFAIRWQDEGPPLPGHFDGYVFSGMLLSPLPAEIMWAVMQPTGRADFLFPWFVGTGIFYKKGAPESFVPGKRGGDCFLFVNITPSLKGTERLSNVLEFREKH